MSEYSSSRPDVMKQEPETGTPLDGERESQIQEQARAYGEEAKERASEYGEKAQQQAEQAKDKTAGGMQRAAEVVRERSGNMSGAPAQTGAKVADTMEKSASYLREHSTSEMLSDVEKYAKEHPGQALAGAVVAGFVLGRILR